MTNPATLDRLPTERLPELSDDVTRIIREIAELSPEDQGLVTMAAMLGQLPDVDRLAVKHEIRRCRDADLATASR